MSTSLFLFGLLHVLANTSLFTKCLATPLPNFPQNYTIDDHNFDRIFYVNADEWKHSLMTSGSFHGDSLSSTQNLGSSASFIFYGTGIWISGPFSPEQARRRIYLDGMDMGLFHANSIFPEPPRPFWGMSGLDDSMHTVVVVHNDSTQMILSIDSWTFQTHSSHHPSRLVNRSSIPTTILSEMGTNVSGVDFSVVGGSTKTPDTVTILLSCIIPTVFLLLCLISYMIHRRVVDTPPGVKANPDSTRPLTHHEPASIPPTSAKVSDPQNSVSALDDYLPSKVIDSGSSTSTGNIVGKQVDSSRHLSTYGTPRNMWAEPSSTSEAGTSPLNLVRPQEPQVVLGTTRGQPSGYYSPRNVTYMISKGSSSAIPGSSLRSTGVTRARSRRENEDNSSSGSEFLFPSAIPSKVVHARGVQLHDEIVGPPLNSPPREIRASHSPTILSNISSLAENEDKVLGLRAHSSRPSAHQEPTDIPPTSREVLNRRKTVTPLDDFVGSWTAGGGPGASTKNIARKQTVSTHPNTYVTTRLKSRRETVTVKGSSKPLRSGPQKGPNVTSRYHQHPPYPSKAPLPRSLGAPAAPIVSSPSVAGSSSRLSYSLSAHRGEDHPPGSGQSTITTTIRLVQGLPFDNTPQDNQTLPSRADTLSIALQEGAPVNTTGRPTTAYGVTNYESAHFSDCFDIPQFGIERDVTFGLSNDGRLLDDLGAHYDFGLSGVDTGPAWPELVPNGLTAPTYFPERDFAMEAVYPLDLTFDTQNHGQTTADYASLQQGYCFFDSQPLVMTSNTSPNSEGVHHDYPYTVMSQTDGILSRFGHDCDDRGAEVNTSIIPSISVTSDDVLTGLTVSPYPLDNPSSQLPVYPSCDPEFPPASTPSTCHDSQVLIPPFSDSNHGKAFGCDSYFPNDALSQLYILVKESPFVLNNQLEPVMSSEEGQELVRAILHVPDCSEAARQKSDRSIFTLFLDCKAYRCLICGLLKTSLERAIGCVRSHLGHRPFVCPGVAVGCISCKKRTR